jgi:long-chain acyl-CoA synthetase
LCIAITSACVKRSDEAPGELGLPLAAYEVRILSPTGSRLPAGQSGELALRGVGMLDAYISPWAPQAQILEDGFFKTGDVASCRADGTVQLLGRLKDVINVGGVKVFPLEVESVLLSHPEVVECRVRGRSEPRLGEQVHAEVQLSAGSDATVLIPQLHAWCAMRLAALKRPSEIIAVGSLPMTASGKVKR